MIVLPVTSDGDRTFSVNVGQDIFSFRTYFIVDRGWLLDIFDATGNPLLVGVALVPGADNLLKGHGDLLRGYQLFAFLGRGRADGIDALGKDLILILYSPGETNLFRPGDVMLTIGPGWTI